MSRVGLRSFFEQDQELKRMMEGAKAQLAPKY